MWLIMKIQWITIKQIHIFNMTKRTTTTMMMTLMMMMLKNQFQTLTTTMT